MLVQWIFSISFMSLLAIFLASAIGWRVKGFDFFPPPSKDSWQYHTFWILFRIMFGGLLLLSFLDFDPKPFFGPTDRYAIWLPLMLVGFGGATYLSAKLGWDNAHGEEAGLVVSGPYRWSRNPIYVTSLLGMLGWALFVNSVYVTAILSLWALLYFLAPFVEESWLERTYGDQFIEYKRSTSRFIGFSTSQSRSQSKRKERR